MLVGCWFGFGLLCDLCFWGWWFWRCLRLLFLVVGGFLVMISGGDVEGALVGW